MIDKHAVAVVKDGTVVGHIPDNLAHRVGQFLRRDVNKAFVEVRRGGKQGSWVWTRSTVHLLSLKYL